MCRCCQIYTSYILLDTYFTIYIYVAYYYSAAVLCCVDIYSTVRTVPCCLFHTTAPPCQLENLLEHSRANMYSKLDRHQKQSKRASQTERTTKHPRTSHDTMLLSPPPVVQYVLEKSGCCNAVSEARLLPLVHTSAQNTKYPFHESGERLTQRDVLCNIMPTPQLKPIFMPELPQIVPGVSVTSCKMWYSSFACSCVLM